MVRKSYQPPFEKFAPEGYAVTQAPYPIISYKQAMLEFGCDKPDLRNPLRIIDVTDFFQKCTFKPFVGRTVRAIKVHAEMSKGFHEKLLKFATDIGMGGLRLSGSMQRICLIRDRSTNSFLMN